MNFGELKTYILDDTKRSDLSSSVASFVRRAEGLIRRELVGYELSATLDETDRVAAGVYTSPLYLLQVRSITGTINSIEHVLTDVGLVNIKQLPSTLDPLHYAVRGDTIEFRGVPETDTEFTVNYFGYPVPLSADGDENDLLTDHEELYIAGAEFYLYQRTEDLELSQAAFGRFADAVEKLNATISRKLGGGGTVGAYNLGNYRVGRGY